MDDRLSIEGTVEDPAERLSKELKSRSGKYTLLGLFVGILSGGYKEATASVSKDAEVMLKMGSTADKREQYRLMRDAMEKRFLRIARGSLDGGVRFGMSTAAFFGMQGILADVRGVPVYDVFNVVGAGIISGAALGLMTPGSLTWRATNVLCNSVIGAGIYFPIGWLYMKFMERALERMNSEFDSKVNEAREVAQSQSRVGPAIDRLENSLEKK